MKGKREQIKKEFEEFADKIAKLESLKHELEALEHKGFETDVALIKSRLKDVNSIPWITREIASLRNKIKEREEEKFKSRIKGKVNIKLLKEERALKRDSEVVKKRVKELEAIIEKKKKVACKKQLSDKEAGFVKDVPKLEKELSELKGEFEEHTKASKMKIDSGVGVIVDTRFGDFLNDIKGEITERLKSKELEMDSQIKMDLEEKERLFAKKYKDLVDEFHDKYKKQVNTELRHEVSSRFDDELNRRLEAEKKKVISALINENIRRLTTERKQILKDLESEYYSKEKDLEENYYSKEKNLKKHEEDVDKKFENKAKQMKEKMHDELRAEVERIKKSDEEKVNRELKQKERELRGEMREEFEAKMKREMLLREAEIEKKKSVLEKHIMAQAKRMLG